MGETTDTLVEEIQDARAALDRDLTALEVRVKQATDWRVQIARRPWLIPGAVAACALIFGYLVGRVVRE